MADLYKEAKKLDDKIRELKAELKQVEDDYNAILYQIRSGNLTSSDYYLAEQKTKKVDAEFFREKHPEYYRLHAHVPHACAARIMAKQHGGEQKFQAYLQEIDPAEFAKYATITVADVLTDFRDSIDILMDEGAVTESVSGYSVKAKPLFMSRQGQGA